MKNGPNATVELYDLKEDVGETQDLAKQYQELVDKATALMQQARTEDPNWPMRDNPGRHR